MSKKKQQKTTYSKRKFMVAFCAAMFLCAAVRHVFTIQVPMLSLNSGSDVPGDEDMTEIYVDSGEEELYSESAESEDEVYTLDSNDDAIEEDIIEEEEQTIEEEAPASNDRGLPAGTDGLRRFPHPIKGVHSWDDCFPDINDVQLVAAQQNGITPVQSRRELRHLIRQHKLVNISNSPYYTVDELTHSMPYLVPKAQHLLNTISLNFIDSLQMKGLPVHLPMVTSVLRTAEDVSRLQRGNGNATTHSCHCYGTTVDITYNRFVPLVGHYEADMPLLRWDLKMKQVLAEVLNDLRQQGLCYVKYERKQACFHLTVR